MALKGKGRKFEGSKLRQMGRNGVVHMMEGIKTAKEGGEIEGGERMEGGGGRAGGGGGVRRSERVGL